MFDSEQIGRNTGVFDWKMLKNIAKKWLKSVLFYSKKWLKNAISKDSKTFGRVFHGRVKQDSLNSRLFADVKNVDDFYLRLSMFAGNKMGDAKDTLVFLDEIQEYPHLLTLLKFLKQGDRFQRILHSRNQEQVP